MSARTAGEDEGAAPRLEAEGVVRDFGPVRAVDGVDLRVAPGELVALFGPNGAGKTTLLRLLSGELRPSAGRVRLGGRSLAEGGPEARRRIGVLSHQGFLVAHLSAAENLRFYGRLYGLRDLDRRVAERLERMGLSAAADRRAGELSRGMRQRLAVARTLLHDPTVVLLDEPYTGLDPHATSLMRGLLRSLRSGGRTVVLVTHHLREGLGLADRAVVLVRGRIVHVEDTPGSAEPERFEERYRSLVEAAG